MVYYKNPSVLLLCSSLFVATDTAFYIDRLGTTRIGWPPITAPALVAFRLRHPQHHAIWGPWLTSRRCCFAASVRCRCLRSVSGLARGSIVRSLRKRNGLRTVHWLTFTESPIELLELLLSQRVIWTDFFFRAVDTNGRPVENSTTASVVDTDGDRGGWHSSTDGVRGRCSGVYACTASSVSRPYLLSLFGIDQCSPAICHNVWPMILLSSFAYEVGGFGGRRSRKKRTNGARFRPY